MRNVVLGWSKACRVKKVKSCDPETFHYYRLGGVYHFMAKYSVLALVLLFERVSVVVCVLGLVDVWGAFTIRVALSVGLATSLGL